MVASFLQTLSYKEPYDFEAILRIFMGVFLEHVQGPGLRGHLLLGSCRKYKLLSRAVLLSQCSRSIAVHHTAFGMNIGHECSCSGRAPHLHFKTGPRFFEGCQTI